MTDPADRKYIGAMVFSGATKIGPNVWEGRVKNLEDGQTYMGKITLNGANSVTLDGCVLGGAICKGETWTRVMLCMAALPDAVAVLRGALGTLDETLEMSTWRHIGLHELPIALLDVDG